MKEIQLTQGKVALVDDDDFEWLNQWKWRISKRGYAYRVESKKIGGKSIYMHVQITNRPIGMNTDHINGIRLDNQRKNLRICTPAQNSKNHNKQQNNTSGYKGVYWDKKNNKWKAQIKNSGKQISLGRYENILDAAMAYNNAAIKYYGDFARPNQL